MRYKFLLASIKKWNFHSNFRHFISKRRGFYAKKPLDLSSSWQFSTRSPFPYVYPAYTCWVFFIIGAEESVSATLQKLCIIFEAFFLHFQSPSDSVYTLLPQGNPCRKHKSDKDFWRCHKKNPVSALTHQWNSVLSAEPP